MISNLGRVGTEIPDLDVTVLSNSSEELTILGQSNGPSICLLQIGCTTSAECDCERGAALTRYFLISSPVSILARPSLDLAIEACADRARALAISHNVVTANLVGIVDGLNQWEFSVGGGVNLNVW